MFDDEMFIVDQQASIPADIEALCRCRAHLSDCSMLLLLLDEIIAIELKIARIASKKALKNLEGEVTTLKPVGK
jgi:hypothetical protein